jgi:hypothetical protein
VISFGAVAQAEEKPSHQVLTAVSSTALSGYVSTSAIWAPGTTGAGAVNPTRAYDGVGKTDGFNLDVINLTVSKPLEEGEWAAGYTAELLVGPDATVFATGAGPQLAIKQAYVALNAPVGNGITFKMGVWDTPIGYEAFNYTANPNYSRSIGYAIEPTTYTGLIASYKVCDGLSVSAGIANQAGVAAVAINARSAIESEKAYLASVSITAPDSLGFLKGSTLTAGVIDHASAAGAAGAANVANFYVGASLNTPIEALKVGAAFDYVGRSRSGGAAAIGTATDSFYGNAVSLYTSYALTEKIKLNTRAEYASGTSSARGLAPFVQAGKAAGGNNSEFLSLTGTVDYALWANVVSRAEIRWDRDVSGGSSTAVAGSSFGSSENAVTVALNIIYKF